MTQKLATCSDPELSSTAVRQGDDDGWRVELEFAIARIDEPAIWKIMGNQQLNGEAHEALVEKISRLQYTHMGMKNYCEIFMMPVIQPANARVINAPPAWKAAKETIKSALISWFDRKSGMLIFEGVLPMDWVTTWRPRVIRQHLARMMPDSDRENAEFEAVELKLPLSAPRLGFLLVGLQQQQTWPQVPELHSLMDKRMRDVVQSALKIAGSRNFAEHQYMNTEWSKDCMGELIVLNPARVQFAITDGVVLWLMKLNESSRIEGWAVAQSMTASDVVRFTLILDAEDVKMTQFTIRIHQIGMRGLSDIVTALNSMAKNVETPADMSKEQHLAMLRPSTAA